MFVPAIYQNVHKAAEIGQMSRVIFFLKSGNGVNIKDAKEVHKYGSVLY